jgi:hypothetical protein
VLWDNSGISVYFFPRGNIPSDITASAPVPEGWGSPSAFWPASSCNPFQFFQNHGAIIDTTLCGDWAGSVWTATGVPGQDQSCAQRTGVATCQQFVQQNGAALSEACEFLLSIHFVCAFFGSIAIACASGRLTLMEQIGKSRAYRSISKTHRKEDHSRLPLTHSFFHAINGTATILTAHMHTRVVIGTLHLF